MLLSREVDDKAVALQREGRLGTFAAVHGQEAAVVGSASALDPARDWVVPQYRELPAMLRQGYPLVRFFLYFRGNPLGNAVPEGVGLLPFQISLAAQIPHAVGLAWGLRHQGRDSTVMTYFGDGASSEGDAHEAMNLAGVHRAPVVFLLQNNGWAISTPVAKQTAAPSFALRAAGYGFPGVKVDGNDVEAVFDAAAAACERARAGGGPTLIECETMRMHGHGAHDDMRYVPKELLAEWEARDPIERYGARLTESYGFSADELGAIRREVSDYIEECAGKALESAMPDPGEATNGVFADDWEPLGDGQAPWSRWANSNGRG
jgi:pyruvate dehydrogenase E1 component alpha subunit